MIYITALFLRITDHVEIRYIMTFPEDEIF